MGLEKNTEKPVFFSPPQSYKGYIMFSPFSVNKVKRFLFAGFVFLAMTAILAGCSSDSNDEPNEQGSLPAALIGKWISNFGDYFEFTNAGGVQTIKYDDGGFGSGYQGSIDFVANYDSKSGVIIVKYTDSTNKNKPNPFHAIYYLNLSNNTTVELNNTWDTTRADYDADTITLNEAITKFTRGNMGNYMDLSYSTTYTKQP